MPEYVSAAGLPIEEWQKRYFSDRTGPRVSSETVRKLLVQYENARQVDLRVGGRRLIDTRLSVLLIETVHEAARTQEDAEAVFARVLASVHEPHEEIMTATQRLLGQVQEQLTGHLAEAMPQMLTELRDELQAAHAADFQQTRQELRGLTVRAEQSVQEAHQKIGAQLDQLREMHYGWLRLQQAELTRTQHDAAVHVSTIKAAAREVKAVATVVQSSHIMLEQSAENRDEGLTQLREAKTQMDDLLEKVVRRQAQVHQGFGLVSSYALALIVVGMYVGLGFDRVKTFWALNTNFQMRLMVVLLAIFAVCVLIVIGTAVVNWWTGWRFARTYGHRRE